MTLWTASFRIDPVVGARNRQRVVAREKVSQLGEPVEPIIASLEPRITQHHHRGGPAPLEPLHELRTERLDTRGGLVVEEGGVVEEAGGPTEPEPQQGVDAAPGPVHHLGGAAAGTPGPKATR